MNYQRGAQDDDPGSLTVSFMSRKSRETSAWVANPLSTRGYPPLRGKGGCRTWHPIEIENTSGIVVAVRKAIGVAIVTDC